MLALGLILARAGSKGLPDKCVRPLLGRPLIAYTFDHALAARRLTGVVLSTDSPRAKALASQRGIAVIDRPGDLASDTARVDAAARHAVLEWERLHQTHVGAVVLLYGNIPVRAAGAIDRALDKLETSGGSSVRTVAPIGKHHPDWLHRLDGDRMTQFRANSISRRQELEPLYYHDGAVVAVRREALFAPQACGDDGQAFLGPDRRALVQQPDDAVDVDTSADLLLAEATLRNAARVGMWERGNVGTDGAPSDAGRCAHGSALLPCQDATPAPAARCHVPSSPRSHPDEFRLAGRGVGPRRPAFVIAEAGVNHDGSLDKALALVDTAVAAGADAVKFQVFKADELASATAQLAGYQRDGRRGTQREMLRRLELDDAAFATIRQRCRERGIAFLATPFSIADVARLAALDVPAVKIASTDLNNTPLLRAAVGLDLPLIVSTGAATADEIRAAVTALRDLGVAERLVLLHCVSAYPTPLVSANLRAISTLAAEFGLPVGLSDHTTDVQTGALAVAAGACVLEKHFTLDPTAAGPDHAMSLAPDGLREYIRRVREAEAALGRGELGMQPIEADVRRVARKSVVAARDRPAGCTIAAEKLAVMRPGGGLEPDRLDALVGRRLATPAPAGRPLTWDMLL